jgi:hypothetical protein
MIPEQTEHKIENKPGFSEVRLQRDGSFVSGEPIAVLQCGTTVIPGFSDRGKAPIRRREKPIDVG